MSKNSTRSSTHINISQDDSVQVITVALPRWESRIVAQSEISPISAIGVYGSITLMISARGESLRSLFIVS